jgi:hypothetical protein
MMGERERERERERGGATGEKKENGAKDLGSVKELDLAHVDFIVHRKIGREALH